MSVIEQAKRELALINFGEEDSAVMVDILERFFGHWESGGAVWEVTPILAKLISAQPLSPLTGEDSEWHDPMGDGIMLQNVRCGSVFKDWRMPDGSLALKAGDGALLIHDIDASDRLAPITFPYDVATRMPVDPIMVVEVSC
jgi:hypothetical protein